MTEKARTIIINIPRKPSFKIKSIMLFLEEHLARHPVPYERLGKIVHEIPYERMQERVDAFIKVYDDWVKEVGVKTYQEGLFEKYKAFVDLNTKDREYLWNKKVSELEEIASRDWFEDLV